MDLIKKISSVEKNDFKHQFDCLEVFIMDMYKDSATSKAGIDYEALILEYREFLSYLEGGVKLELPVRTLKLAAFTSEAKNLYATLNPGRKYLLGRVKGEKFFNFSALGALA